MRSKRWLAVASLFVVAACLAIVVGSGADAETGANWKVEGKNIEAGLLPFIKVREVEILNSPTNPGRHIVLLTTVGGNPIAILCGEIVLSEFHLIAGGGSLGKIFFKQCIIRINGKEAPACTPKGEGVSGEIATKSLNGLIVLSEAKEGLLQLEPKEGETFSTIEMSEECSLGETLAVKGKLILEDANGQFSTEVIARLFQAGPGSNLRIGAQALTIDGSVILELTGAHAAMKWSGQPS